MERLPSEPASGATPATPTVEDRLAKIEAMLAVLVDRETAREWYSTAEFAQIVGKAEFTCREWCRRRRIRAEKRTSGRGSYPSWVISHQELLRYQREGLLPLPSGVRAATNS